MSRAYFQDTMLSLTRVFRSRLFMPIAKPLIRLGVHADHVTLVSFMSGLIAVWFAFSSHSLFILFALIHLFGDAIDGVIARATKPTIYGEYLDKLNDQSIAVLLLLKFSVIQKNQFILAVIVLFVLHMAIYVLSRRKYPVIFIRLIVFIAFILKYPLAGTIIAGGATVLGLVLQFYQFTLFSRKKKAM